MALLGRANLAQLQYDEAVRLCDEAVSRLRATDDRPGLALALMYAGLAADFAGRGEVACGLFEEVLDVCAELGWRSLRARGSINQGAALMNLGDLKAAREALSEGLPASLELGDRFVVPIALGTFAGLAARTGRPRLAMRLSGAAEAVADAGQFAIPTPVTDSGVAGDRACRPRSSADVKFCVTLMSHAREVTVQMDGGPCPRLRNAGCIGGQTDSVDVAGPAFDAPAGDRSRERATREVSKVQT